MKKVIIAVLCTVFMVSVWAAGKQGANVKWQKDIAAAQKSLKSTAGKSILLFFTAPGWCGPCRMLESGPIAAPEFAAIVKKNAAVRVDFSDRRKVSQGDRALIQKFAVRGFPTMIVLDAGGKEKGRIVGYRPAKDFFAEIEKLIKK